MPMSKPPSPPSNSSPVLSAEEILGQIRSKAATLADVDADLVRIVSDHLVTATPAPDAVELAMAAVIALSEQHLAKGSA
jgi:hypothetical protein